jgi:uncharacterized protein (TIGR03083 family)
MAMDEEQSWQVIERERLNLADLLDDLTPTQWESASLCAGWRVRDVAAHLSLVGEPPPPWSFVTNGARSRGNFHRLNTIMTKSRAEQPTAAIVDSLRLHAGSRQVPIVTNYRNVQFDLLVHIQDVAIPLGRELAMPVAAAQDSASRVWTMGWPFWAKRRLRGLHLVATDGDWEAGAGLELHGAIADLLLLLTGRSATIDRLTGPGIPALASLKH